VLDALTWAVPFSAGRDISARVREAAREASTTAAASADAPLPECDTDLTYGETPFRAIADALGKIETRFGGLPPRGRGVFADVGCGTGKPLFAAALLHEWRACVGVEVIEELLGEAETLVEEWQGGLPFFEKVRATCSLSLFKSRPDSYNIYGAAGAYFSPQFPLAHLIYARFARTATDPPLLPFLSLPVKLPSRSRTPLVAAGRQGAAPARPRRRAAGRDAASPG
jgi:hypothetical protein